jgi:UDP-N-acetylmuramate--alanine ligase
MGTTRPRWPRRCGRCAISSGRRTGGGRLICVFQPHQHSRTRHLLEEFAQAFSAADVVIVPHIYFVRDSQEEKHKVTAADLVDRLRGRGVKAMHLYPFEAIVEQLETLCRGGDLVVVMGAGPVYEVGRGFMAGR